MSHLNGSSHRRQHFVTQSQSSQAHNSRFAPISVTPQKRRLSDHSSDHAIPRINSTMTSPSTVRSSLQSNEQTPRKTVQHLANRFCESLHTAVAGRNTSNGSTRRHVDPLEEMYSTGSSMVPFLVRNMSTVFRGIQTLSGYGKTALKKTLNSAKRRAIGKIPFLSTEGKAKADEDTGDESTVQKARDLRQRITGMAKDENPSNFIYGNIPTSQRQWREQHAATLDSTPRALQAQAGGMRRIRKFNRKSLNESQQPRVALTPAERRRQHERRKELRNRKQHVQQLATLKEPPPELPTPAEKQARMEKEAWNMLSDKAKKAILEGQPIWRSPVEEEREEEERLQKEREKRTTSLFEDPLPYLVPPTIPLRERIYVEPSEDQITSDEEVPLPENATLALLRGRRKEDQVPWWLKPEPLGPPISSTKMWQDWFRPPPVGPTLNPICKKWRKRVEQAMRAPGQTPVAKTLRGETLTKRDLSTCFRQCEWLNDEVINAYLALIADYANRQKDDDDDNTAKKKGTPKYHAFNSFFHSSLRKGGYNSVRRWAKRAKIGGEALLSVDTVFVPVHDHSHWTLIIIRPKARTIENLDSLGGVSASHVRAVENWLEGELGNNYRPEEWEILPTISSQQNNSSDCGVFLLTNAKVKMLGTELEFGPKDIPDIRIRIVAELINGSLDGDFENEDDDG